MTAPAFVLLLLAADPAARLAEKAAAELEPIAAEYERSGRPQDAERVRAAMSPPALSLLPLDWPPNRRLPAAADVAESVRGTYAAERRAAADLAADVFRLSRAALTDRRPAEAFRLTNWALALDSDYAPVRKALGFEAYGGGWTTPFLERMAKDGRVWDDRFGWRTPQQVARYEAGERYVNGRWVTPEAEAALRKHFRNAWTVETEHFRVRTNKSLETAVTLASRLEDFRTYFVRNYTLLFDAPRRGKTLLPGSSPVRKHQVQVFATRAEYVTELAPKQRGVEVSRGVYLPQDRVSYFFASEDESTPVDGELTETLFHEVSHQLLYECDSRVRDVGRDRGYWAVEGFACYLESFETDGRSATAEHPGQNRVRHAAGLVAESAPAASLEALDAMGKAEFLRTADVEALRERYAAATALTHFLLHFENGRYRDGFLVYLRSLYESDRRRPTLAECVGVPAAVLDMQYRDYVASL